MEAVPTLPPVKIEYDIAVSEEAVQGIVEATRGVPQEEGVVGIVGEVRGDYGGEAGSKWCISLKDKGREKSTVLKLLKP